MIPFKYSSKRNISPGAIKYFNESNICDKDPTHTNYLLDSIFCLIDSELSYKNKVYDSFWKNLRADYIPDQRRYSKKQMKEFVNLCWNTYKNIQIQQKLDNIYLDF